jgi:hypothetical protein
LFECTHRNEYFVQILELPLSGIVDLLTDTDRYPGCHKVGGILGGTDATLNSKYIVETMV